MRASHGESRGQQLAAIAALGAGLLLAACSETDPRRFGCVADTDCRASRICTAGVCMNPASTPPGSDAGGTSDAPTVMTSDAATVTASADALTITLPPSTVDAGAAPDGATAGAAVKFCNNIRTPGGENHPLTIVFETAPGKPRLTADSGGACTPPAPQPCQPIPAGPTISFTIWDSSGMVGSGAITDVAPGDQWLLRAEADSTGQGGIYGDRLQPSVSCSSVGAFEGTGDAGAGGGGGDSGGPTADGSSVTCQSGADASTCSRCVSEMCCPEISGCLNNPACRNLLACDVACAAGDSACESACSVRYPDGRTPLNSYLLCAAGKRNTPCGA